MVKLVLMAPLLMVTFCVPAFLQATSTLALPPAAEVQATVTAAGTVQLALEDASGTLMSRPCGGSRLASAASVTVTLSEPGVRSVPTLADRLTAGS